MLILGSLVGKSPALEWNFTGTVTITDGMIESLRMDEGTAFCNTILKTHFDGLCAPGFNFIEPKSQNSSADHSG